MESGAPALNHPDRHLAFWRARTADRWRGLMGRVGSVEEEKCWRSRSCMDGFCDNWWLLRPNRRPGEYIRFSENREIWSDIFEDGEPRELREERRGFRGGTCRLVEIIRIFMGFWQSSVRIEGACVERNLQFYREGCGQIGTRGGGGGGSETRASSVEVWSLSRGGNDLIKSKNA